MTPGCFPRRTRRRSSRPLCTSRALFLSFFLWFVAFFLSFFLPSAIASPLTLVRFPPSLSLSLLLFLCRLRLRLRLRVGLLCLLLSLPQSSLLSPLPDVCFFPSFLPSFLPSLSAAPVAPAFNGGGHGHRDQPLSRVTNGSVIRVWQQLKREKSLMAKQSGGRE